MICEGYNPLQVENGPYIRRSEEMKENADNSGHPDSLSAPYAALTWQHMHFTPTNEHGQQVTQN